MSLSVSVCATTQNRKDAQGSNLVDIFHIIFNTISIQKEGEVEVTIPHEAETRNAP